MNSPLPKPKPNHYVSEFIKERMVSFWTRKWMGRLWFRFLLPYLLFLLLTLIAGWIAYQETIDVLEREVLERNGKALHQAQTLLETRIAEVESIVQQVADHPKVRGFQVVKKPFAGTNTYKVMSTQKALDDYSISNRFLKDYFVVFRNSSLVISPHRVEALDEFYEDVLRYRDWDMTEWREQTLETYHSKDFIGLHTVKYGTTEEGMITYIRSLGYPGYYQGAVVALIPHAEVAKLLSGINVQAGGWVRVLDKHGQLIGQAGDEAGSGQRGGESELAALLERPNTHYRTELNGRDMLVSRMISSKTGWTYIAAQPADEVLESVHAMKRTTFTLVGLSLVVIVLLALWLSRRNSRPLEGLYSYVHTNAKPGLGQRSRKSDIFAYLRDAFTELLETTKTLDQKLSERQEYARMAVFDRWLRGGYATDQQLESSLTHAGLQRSATMYAVAVLHLGWHGDDWSAPVLDEMVLKMLVVKEEASGLERVPFDLHEAGQDQVALLFYGTEAEAEGGAAARFAALIEQTLRELNERLKSAHILPMYTIGGIVSDRMDVPRSLEQAQQLYGMSDGSQDLIWWNEEEHADAGMYRFNAEMENRLTHAVRGGDEEEVARLCQTVWQDNWEKRPLTCPMERWLLMDMYAAAMKLAQSLDLTLQTDSATFQQKVIKKGAELHKLFPLVRNEFVQLSRTVHERKRSRNATLLEDMMSCIREGYVDSSLSLTVISDRLQVSEAYVSAFFKEQTGRNFSDYVEELRLEHAKQLMLEGDALTSIAERVGYNSLNSFSRAFKRAHGMSATEYRKWLNEQKRNNDSS
ncbi:AraC family transcriptional regulator [Paenibacillus thiaminolyticus]|uniref:AraC family transcriptional regulator n=1 Tax=Paenibacillus thiaminolyticus TaxID=49283 RepID=UPI00232C67DF|nr:AraC family transcriptional regulator [Paenibacillus thiaminolyticus]WCF06393.1 AraC family transcriptional regulator [Paenibacillus thiaminolyticus]